MKFSILILGTALASTTVPLAAAVTIGHPIVPAPNHDGASGSIFILTTDENAPGTVTDFSFFDNDFSGRAITPIIMKSSGLGFEITGIGATRTSDGSGAQTAPFGLVSGSAEFGLGSALAWKDGGNGTNNAGTAEWLNATPGRVAWLGAGQTSFSTGDNVSVANNFNRTYSVGATIADAGDLVGNTLTNRGSNDGANGSIFVLDDPFVGPGNTIADWSFFDNDTAGREITPLLLSQGGLGWEIAGIGTTRVSDASGTQYHPFDLVSGSGNLGPGVYLGFKDGGNGTNNQGVIDWDGLGGGPSVFWLGQGRTSFAPGTSYGLSGTFDRTYAIQAFGIPEPQLPGLLAMGFAAMALVRRRR